MLTLKHNCHKTEKQIATGPKYHDRCSTLRYERDKYRTRYERSKSRTVSSFGFHDSHVPRKPSSNFGFYNAHIPKKQPSSNFGFHDALVPRKPFCSGFT